MNKVFERQGNRSEVYTRRYPDIIGGVCEYCGVLDKSKPSEEQYTVTHVSTCTYSTIGGLGELRCTYCPESVNPVDVVKQRKLTVHESPTNPGQLIAVCDSYECSRKHENRFKLN